MQRVLVLSSEGEEEESEVSSISLSSVVTSGRLSDASTLSSDSIWDKVSDWEPYIAQMDSNTQPTCIPPLYDSRRPDPSIKDKCKFYNVYAGELVGCYREWYIYFSNNSILTSNLRHDHRADAGGRVTGIPGNLHKSYPTWEQALEAWKQHCCAYHRHAPEFVNGSTFQLDSPISLPEPVTPRHSQHNVVLSSSSSQGPSSSAASPASPRPSKPTRTRTPKDSSSSVASFGSPPPDSDSGHRRRAWAIHGTKDHKSIVTM